MQAEANIQHPARLLISGKAGSGKTWLAVDLIDRVLRHQVNRLIVICPTWYTQSIFRCLDGMVKPDRDVFEDLENDTFEEIYKQILQQVRYCAQNNKEPIKTLLFIDDCGSNNLIHGGRISCFGKLAIQFRHLNVSSIVIVQNPKLVSPNYRENANHFIFFPCHRLEEMEWIYKEFNPSFCQKKTFFKILLRAWGLKNNEENDGETTFIYIYCPPRHSIRFFKGFSSEFTLRKRPLIMNEILNQ